MAHCRHGAGPGGIVADSPHPALGRITTLHTLGPPGTNCELAAYRWFDRVGTSGGVVLYPTLEAAADRVVDSSSGALIVCSAYPELHTLIYSRLGQLRMVDCIMASTHNMVIARRRGTRNLESISVHHAPAAPVPDTFRTRLPATSNSAAARSCRIGAADACITTMPAAIREALEITHDFGPIVLGFSVHIAIHAEL
ncbi:MAG: hypothetical protein ACRDKW_14430 [Actinomycetota bacterium]